MGMVWVFSVYCVGSGGILSSGERVEKCNELSSNRIDAISRCSSLVVTQYFDCDVCSSVEIDLSEYD